MSEQPFLVPDDFRAFMQRVVAYLDTPGEDKFLDAEDALQDETGYGGRIDGDSFRFTYITRDGHHKWELPLREPAIRDIADGLLIEIVGERHDVGRTQERQPVGSALLVWGEYRDDALAIQSDEQLAAALDALHMASSESPRMLRLWSAMDDQCVAVLRGGLAALYVVESIDGYGSSIGDRARTDSFEVLDHDGKPLTVPFNDCIPWEVARRSLLQFVHQGELASEVVLEGRIPSLLLMMGDIDRKAALAMRGEAPTELGRSSLPQLSAPIPAEVMAVDEATAPVDVVAPLRLEELAAWGRRLIEVLYARELIELARNSSLDEITYQLGGLLQAHGAEAQDSLETADWLANEIGALPGIAKLFATGGDLQLALRRSRHA